MANSKSFNSLLWAAVLAASFSAVVVTGFQFQVGDKGRGWRIPTGDEPETYNEWASKNRFHIGDTLHFKYAKDSVLLVNSADYLSCNASNPTSKFEDGDTVFKFTRSGPFYFISGKPGHCKLGQRLIIRVIHPLDDVQAPVLAPGLAPAPAPAPGPVVDTSNDGDSTGERGGPHKSSSGKLSVACYAATAFVGLSVVACLFM